jgi:hypothetical protein
MWLAVSRGQDQRPWSTFYVGLDKFGGAIPLLPMSTHGGSRETLKRGFDPRPVLDGGFMAGN